MDDSSYDPKKIRRISAHLRQLHLDDYLKSRSFNLLCEAYDCDEIWGEIVGTLVEQYSSKGLKFNLNNYPDSHTDNLFKKFIITTYLMKKERFAEIIPEFLSDYSKWSPKFYDLNESTPITNDLIKTIGEDLLDLDFGQGDVFMYFHHAGYNLENIMDLHDIKVDQQSIVELSTIKKEEIPSNRKIFIVHGHDEAIKNDVERFLKSLDLEPIILHKQADLGKTIIEKVEHYSDVSFALIILTADDFGGKALVGDEENETEDPIVIFPKYLSHMIEKFSNFLGEPRAHILREEDLALFTITKNLLKVIRMRARQNVVFECGFFIGHLRRSKVAILCEENIELPSDLQGLCYTVLDKNGDWRAKIAEEIDKAGIKIDMSLVK
jgi:predicted nucleotide-binding protein